MEIWLESLSMHLSVGMPLPSDLLFDILHYRGVSPSSSGSTTPEGIPTTLEPISEKKPQITPPTEFPNYENIDFLKNDTNFIKNDTPKEIAIQTLKTDNKPDSSNNNMKFLRKVPKNFTRNRFLDSDANEKTTNLSLQSIKATVPSRVTEKYVNATRLPAIFKKTTTDGAGVSSAGQSSGLVRNIIESLNRKERGRLDLGARSTYGRSSLKVTGTPKIGKQYRSCSPEEYTAL